MKRILFILLLVQCTVFSQEIKEAEVADTLKTEISLLSPENLKTINVQISKFINVPPNTPKGVYRVYIKFKILEDNTLSDLKIVKDPGYGLGNEVKKVFNKLPSTDPDFILKLKGDNKVGFFYLPVTVHILK
ncbi:hypothetical protein [Flavobacterium subsaxonicum]|uniref:TonB C-terminal domain-containing protein n=1 Tax=Flavobacterium subsaxonicum WB 4.1-42 = DSM 21790 TaxID=1121898 RepID=A0A0A2MK35_9FLAO|nr:hypothetical protein [Flavobacterium subsaxonicum]KGO93007.1 hypothetical protein Q766_10325 [Flavobacterium subsaxonicum WB 4.1-42 = DSM 21790]